MVFIWLIKYEGTHTNTHTSTHTHTHAHTHTQAHTHVNTILSSPRVLNASKGYTDEVKMALADAIRPDVNTETAINR